MVTNEGYGALAPQLGPLEHAPDPCLPRAVENLICVMEGV